MVSPLISVVSPNVRALEPSHTLRHYVMSVLEALQCKDHHIMQTSITNLLFDTRQKIVLGRIIKSQHAARTSCPLSIQCEIFAFDLSPRHYVSLWNFLYNLVLLLNIKSAINILYVLEYIKVNKLWLCICVVYQTVCNVRANRAEMSHFLIEYSVGF